MAIRKVAFVKGIAVGMVFLFLSIVFLPTVDASIAMSRIREVQVRVVGPKLASWSVPLSEKKMHCVESMLDEAQTRLASANRRDAAIIVRQVADNLSSAGLLQGTGSRETPVQLQRGRSHGMMPSIFSFDNPQFANICCLVFGSVENIHYDYYQTFDPHGPLEVLGNLLINLCWWSWFLYELGVNVYIFGTRFPVKVLNVIDFYLRPLVYSSVGMKGDVNSSSGKWLLGYTGLMLAFFDRTYFIGASVAII